MFVTMASTAVSSFRVLAFILLFESQLVLAQTNLVTRSHESNGEDKSPCIRPVPLFSAEDYSGPFNKVVVYLSRKPEIKTVHQHPWRPGSSVCSLTAPEKFRLFVTNTMEPVTFIETGFNAGLAQAQDQDPRFGQGAGGYAKRYGAALADDVAGDFLHTFLLPVVFRQDPRYYRQLEGSTTTRLGHALSHVFVAKGDSGSKMFNFSEWMGTTSMVFLSNAYHPGNAQGLRPAARRIGMNVATDAASDMVREFWPEIVHKLRLPFKEHDHRQRHRSDETKSY
jgi:hypothetical protein